MSKIRIEKPDFGTEPASLKPETNQKTGFLKLLLLLSLILSGVCFFLVYQNYR